MIIGAGTGIDTAKLKTPTEAAKLLSKSHMTIYRWLKGGQIMGVIIADHPYIPKEEIDRILKQDTPLTQDMMQDKV